VRILLDESLPRPFARLLPEHEVRTVAAMGWKGIRNSALLQLAAGDFDAFLTADQSLEHQQNLGALPLAAMQSGRGNPSGHRPRSGPER
jgi:Domain of unknown function (DUF5615)